MATIVGENRFSPITPNDHAGSLWIAALLCLVYSVITLALRGHLKWPIYGIDDYLALTATVIQVGQVAAVLVGLNHGLGKTEDLLRSGELVKASRAAFAGQVLFLLSAACAKAATLFLMMRLFNLTGPQSAHHTRSKVHFWTCITVLGAVALWGILSIVAVAVNCSIPTFIQADQGQCGSQFLRWQIITAFDVATEVILVLISIFVVWPVQLKLSMKFQVVMAFSFRLPVAALSILHLHYVAEYTKSTNPGVAIVNVIAVQQVELCWSLITATIPNLKSFVKSFSSGFGIQLDPSLTQASYGSNSGRNGYELGSVKSKNTSKMRSVNKSYNEIDEQRPGRLIDRDHSNTIRDHESIESIGSQDHIIRKEVQWQVHYETTPDGPGAR